MIVSRKQRKKQDTTINTTIKQFNNEIYGIFTIALGLILFVIVYGNSIGRIGELIKFVLMGLFSTSVAVLPYLLLIYGVFIFINKSLMKKKKTVFFYLLIFISITIFKSLAAIDKVHSISANTNMAWLKEVFTLGTQGIGGGIIGISISILLVSLFGVTITYIIISTLLLISLILHTNISLVSTLANIKDYLIKTIQRIYKGILNFIFVPVKDNNENIKRKVEKKKNSEPHGLKESIPFEKEDSIEDKIKILDFSGSEAQAIVISDSSPEISTSMNQVSSASKEALKSGDSEINISYNNVPQAIAYQFPDIELLNQVVSQSTKDDTKKIKAKAKILEETLLNFGVEAKVVQVNKGPTITRYELQPSAGVKVSKIVNLSDDIALNLAAQAIRIEAPIPGKAAIGIEIPNEDIATVALREVIDTPTYKNSNLNLPFALGKDVSGTPIVTDITKMPHLLVAGATGSGKSVCINTLILSILYNASPDMVKLVLIDPKVVELNQYNGIPHLLIPVVTDPKKATSALNWALQEMTKRYKMFAENGVRDIDGYNNKLQDAKIPYIVIIIDELADLMMVAPNDVEDAICRLAQMARAAGLHLIIATQRPSVDVITGVIKANIPSRIAFSVASQADSRTILDMGGAEKLLGKGDMLFYPVGASKPVRIQGAFISEKEIERIVTFIKEQTNEVHYETEIVEQINQNNIETSNNSDELFNEALKIVVEGQQASISMLQRRLRIGYNRAARLIDEMEAKGFVGAHEGSKPRQVLIDMSFFEHNTNE